MQVMGMQVMGMQVTAVRYALMFRPLWLQWLHDIRLEFFKVA